MIFITSKRDVGFSTTHRACACLTASCKKPSLQTLDGVILPTASLTVYRTSDLQLWMSFDKVVEDCWERGPGYCTPASYDA